MPVVPAPHRSPARRVARRTAAALAVVSAACAWPAGAGAQSAGDPLRDQQWYLDAIGADRLPAGADGRGVLVAVVDSGVDATHPDLAGRVRIGPDLVDGRGAGKDPNGHGTHLAGLIVAARGNGIGIAGAAPGAEVLSVRVLDDERAGTTAGAARGIDAAVAAGARVVNVSLGPSPEILDLLGLFDPFAQALQRAVDAGVVVVAAAGNQSLPLCAQPPLVTGLLCVEALDRDGRRASYSNYGLRVDVVAPGGEPDLALISTAPGGGYETLAGTSQAAPLVSAAAATLLALGLDGPQVVARIKATARDLGPRGPDLEYGDGLVDLPAAVAGLDVPADPGPVAAVRLAGATRRSARIATVLRRGFRLRCAVTPAGRCTARARTSGGVTVLRGVRATRVAGAAATVTLRPTTAGRRMLRRTRRLALRLTASGAGRTTPRVLLTLRR